MYICLNMKHFDNLFFDTKNSLNQLARSTDCDTEVLDSPSLCYILKKHSWNLKLTYSVDKIISECHSYLLFNQGIFSSLHLAWQKFILVGQIFEQNSNHYRKSITFIECVDKL
jgi:hypothetical protein